MHWLSICFIFCILQIQGQIIEDTGDFTNDVVWGYLQLRPDDIFDVINASTSLTNVARLYYGDDSHTKLIRDANPDMVLSGLDYVKPPFQLRLPSIIRCLDYLPMSCIEKSFLFTGQEPNIQFRPINLDMGVVPDGRLLQDFQYQEEGVQAFTDKIENLKDLDLSLDVTNYLSTNLAPQNPGPFLIPPLSGYVYEQKVKPYEEVSYDFQVVTLWNQKFSLSIRVSLAPTPDFPFSNIGHRNWVQVHINGATNTSSRYISPKIYSVQGPFTTNTPSGPGESNLNVTITIESDMVSTHVKVIIDEFYGSARYLGNLTSQIRAIMVEENRNLRLESTNQPSLNSIIASNIAINRATQGWKLVSVYGNYYRIVHVANDMAISIDITKKKIVFESADENSQFQLWTIIPIQTSSGEVFAIKYDNDTCWSLDITKLSPLGERSQSFPLKLYRCNTEAISQRFRITSIVPTTSFWSQDATI